MTRQTNRPVANSVLVQLKKHKHAIRYQQGEEKTATMKMTEKMV
mgnify:CR=1 FL=1